MDRTTQSLIIVLAKILTGNDRAAGADANAKPMQSSVSTIVA